jgi:hypothetical protein
MLRAMRTTTRGTKVLLGLIALLLAFNLARGSGTSRTASAAPGPTEFTSMHWQYDDGFAKEVAEAKQRSSAQLKEMASQGWRVVGYSVQIPDASPRLTHHFVLLQRN